MCSRTLYALQIPLLDVVAMQTRQASLERTGEITLRHLVKEALRMRPTGSWDIGKCATRTRPGRDGRAWSPFALNHIALGGVRVGKVIRLIEGVGPWIDAVAEIDDSPVGGAVLDGLGADGGRLPVSVAFDPDPGGMVRWPADPLSGLPGVQRTRARLRDIAIVEAAQFVAAYTYSRGTWTSMIGIGDRAA